MNTPEGCKAIGNYFFNTTSELMHFKLQFTDQYKWAAFGQNTFIKKDHRMVRWISIL
jgi:hypothetical protein